MNVLFISISSLPHLSGHSISLDLLHEFQRNGHNVHVVCALEKKEKKDTYCTEEVGCKVLRVKVGNNKKASLIEKGVTTLLLPKIYIAAIKKYYSDVKFDLVLYPTPPVTQVETVKFIKKRDGAKAYLLLKDIFPQNAVDIGLMTKNGIKGIIYKHFRNVERKLYAVSDFIGCMSQANVEYLLEHNPQIDSSKVEICPNSVEVVDMSVNHETREKIRKKYDIPCEKKVFVYGGNLGKPQGIDFMIECLKKQKMNKDILFIIVGDGTEFGKIETFMSREKPANVRLMRKLPKDEYDKLVAACDVGLIFLDHRFTIPNFPSRLLGYMQAKIPVFAITDPNTDIGKIVVDGGFGWWCESNDVDSVANTIELIVKNLQKLVDNNLREKEFNHLYNLYSVGKAYDKIIESYYKL